MLLLISAVLGVCLLSSGLLAVWVDQPPAPIKALQRDSQLASLHHVWYASVATYASSIRHPLSSGNIVEEQAWAYLDIARRNASVVCETGFWKGVSAHLWLTADESVQLHSFDTDFPRTSVNALRAQFGGSRLHMHKGSTRATLPRFRPPAPCDIVSIDASHDGWEPYHDLMELLPHARCGAHVLFDDTFDDRRVNASLDNDPWHLRSFYNACTRSYWQLVREGKLAHVGCIDLGRWPRYGKFPKGFCHARTLCAPRAGGDATRAAKWRTATPRAAKRAQNAPSGRVKRASRLRQSPS